MTVLAVHGGEPAVRHGQVRPWPPVDGGARASLVVALDPDRLGYGVRSVTRRLEEDFARRHGVRHAIACNSGTTALLLAYFACGLLAEEGARPPQVIVPAYGFFATVSPLLYLGAEPVFCDVDPELGTLDVDRLEAAITVHTKAVVVTHIAGHPVDMPALLRITRPRGIAVIEDCSHAHGASLDGRLVGTWGDIAAFSLQTGKLLSAGEGGIVLTDSDTHLERASMLGNFRRLEGTALRPTSGLEETGLGLKLRMSPLSAALASYYLSVMDELIAARQARLRYLTARLAERAAGFVPPATRPGAFRGAFYEYRVRTLAPFLPFVRAALAAEGCSLPHSNTRAIHALPIFRRPLDISLRLVLGRAPHAGQHDLLEPALPMTNAEALGASTFTLPTFTFEPYELIDAYVEALAKVAAYLNGVAEEVRG
jgi:perosamine synthetase